MQESTHDWTDLLTRYLQNTITPVELEELYRQIKSDTIKKEQFSRLIDPEQYTEELKELYKIDTKAGWKRLTTEIPALKEGLLISIYRHPYFKPIAGLFLVGVALFFFLTRRQEIDYVYLQVNDKIINLEARKDNSKANICYAVVTKLGMTAKVKNAFSFELAACSIFQLVTPPGKIFQIELSDGTIVTLNANSRLSFPALFTGNKRDVSLTGEAYFNVKNNNTPFKIITPGKKQIEVTGTEFIVTAYADTVMQTTLFAGTIQVTSQDTVLSLKPGEQLRLTDKGIRFSEAVNIEQAKAFTGYFFDFDYLNVEEMMKQIGYWYGYKITIKGNISKKTSMGRIARTEPMGKILEAIEKLNEIDIEKSGKELIVRGAE